MLEQFTVGTSNLTVKHQLIDKNNMNIKFIIFSNKSIRKTGSGENIVNSYQELNYQDCKLQKIIFLKLFEKGIFNYIKFWHNSNC
ncbi:MAG: hypothetical protein U0354_12180 [Candidatus Sericytochromatia bacterium]